DYSLDESDSSKGEHSLKGSQTEVCTSRLEELSPPTKEASPMSSTGARSLLGRMGQLENEMLSTQRSLEKLRCLLPSDGEQSEASPLAGRLRPHPHGGNEENEVDLRRLRA
ncbi:hypothetical protein FOZ63_022238, partial [Perkinsus olseni]